MRLLQAIRGTDVRLVNSLAEANRDIHWPRNYSWILVGGQVLDRGFTVEGLTVTYMPRGPGGGITLGAFGARSQVRRPRIHPRCPRTWSHGEGGRACASLFEGLGASQFAPADAESLRSTWHPISHPGPCRPCGVILQWATGLRMTCVPDLGGQTRQEQSSDGRPRRHAGRRHAPQRAVHAPEAPTSPPTWRWPGRPPRMSSRGPSGCRGEPFPEGRYNGTNLHPADCIQFPDSRHP